MPELTRPCCCEDPGCPPDTPAGHRRIDGARPVPCRSEPAPAPSPNWQVCDWFVARALAELSRAATTASAVRRRIVRTRAVARQPHGTAGSAADRTTAVRKQGVSGPLAAMVASTMSSPTPCVGRLTRRAICWTDAAAFRGSAVTRATATSRTASIVPAAWSRTRV